MNGKRKRRPVHIPIKSKDSPDKPKEESGSSPVQPDEKRRQEKGQKEKPASRERKEETESEATSPEDAESLRKKAREYDDLLDTLQRLKAEYANYQKRTEKERELYREECVRDIYLKLLPVVDNIERAIAAVREHEAGEELLSGVKLILNQFHQILAAEGVTHFESEGKKFDPRYHEAVMLDVNDEVPPETVVSEVLRGYMIGDRILRPAKVTVSRKLQKTEPPDE